MSLRTALICENGHLSTWYLEAPGKHDTPFCKQCGAKTIDTCPACGTSITGREGKEAYFEKASRFPVSHPIPGYCHNCGMPYPWTEAAIQAALEYADELENLTDDEKKQLKISIKDLAKDSPQTQVAALRFKKLATKMGASAAKALRDILVDVMSEAAKKALVP